MLPQSDDKTDEKILICIQNHCGARPTTIAKALNKNVNTIRYRLLTLELQGKVIAVRQRGAATYFVARTNEGGT